MLVRILSATVLIPVLIVFLAWLPKVCTAALFGVICAIGAYELLKGTGLVKQVRLVIYSMLSAFGIAIVSFYGFSYPWFLGCVLIFAAILFAELLISKAKLSVRVLSLCILGGIVVPFLLSAVIRIFAMDKGRFLVYAPFIAAFASDTGAYFVGKFLGKHKLAPIISPKKTVEGFLGGLASAVLTMLLYCLILQFACGLQVNYFYALIYGILGSAAGVFGDLCFSAIKRQVGIKDYGKLIPGHGGILDRFDSVIMVAPLLELLFILIPMAV